MVIDQRLYSVRLVTQELEGFFYFWSFKNQLLQLIEIFLLCIAQQGFVDLEVSSVLIDFVAHFSN